MAKITIPYGTTGMELEIPANHFNGIHVSALPPAVEDERAEIERALDGPIGSPRLEELARGKCSAVIIASDHTRPVPSRIITPLLLERLRRGAPGIDVTILVATGFHRATTRAELEEKFGPEIAAKEKIVVHDSRDPAMLVKIGTLPSGGDLIVNRLAVETELLIAEGFIEPHFFAGFSGGRKSVLPGIAARETVLANHCAEFIASPFARTGNLENNPIHRDMLYAAEKARLAFIANVVINGQKRIVRAFAGDRVKAHAAGCDFLRKYCGITVPESDVVVTSNGGYPLDQNVYQSVKGMTAAEAVCRRGGVIIIAAACSDGHGGESFYRHLADAASPAELLEKTAAVPRDQTEPDQWEFQILARILKDHTVIVVTRNCDHKMLEAMHLQTASSMAEALEKAHAIVGKDAALAVIPDGVSVISRKQ